MHGRSVNTIQTHTGHAVSTHFGGHNLGVHSTQTNSLVVTPEWELLLSELHSPSQPSLPTTHCTLHACTPLSAAGHMTTLLGGRSLGWLVGSFAGDAPHSTHPLQSGGRRPPHSLCSPRTTPTRVDQYRRTPHSNWYVSICVLCVWTTGASLAGTTHRIAAVSYSLSECDPRVVYTLWWTVGGALPGRGHLMHSSLVAKSSSHECLVVLGWRRWGEGGGAEGDGVLEGGGGRGGRMGEWERGER